MPRATRTPTATPTTNSLFTTISKSEIIHGAKGAKKQPIYDNILRDVLASGAEAVKLNIDAIRTAIGKQNLKAVSIAHSLRSRIKENEQYSGKLVLTVNVEQNQIAISRA